jgi:hypothetical protein
MTPEQPRRVVARLFCMRAVKAVAAAAVVCVMALSGCTASQRIPVSVPANASLPPPGGMPGFYLVVAGLEVVVRASADGHVTGTAAIPGPGATGPTWLASEPFGSPDGRHFVIAVSRGGQVPGVADVTLFRLTVSPDGQPGRLSRVTFDSTGESVTGAALSPDGRMLALSLLHDFGAGPPYGSVEIVDLADGAIRTWTGQSTPHYWPGIPAWADPSTIVVPWWHSTTPPTVPAEVIGIRHLDIVATGGSLAAAPLAAFPSPVPVLQSAMIASGGGQIIASSCGASHHTATARIVELSATNGQLIRVLRTQTDRFGTERAAQAAVYSPCQVLSVAGDGDHVLVQAFAFGRIDNGVFTSLAGTTPRVLPVSAAW